MKELLTINSQELIEQLIELYQDVNIPETEIVAEWLVPSTLILYFPCAGESITIDVTDPHLDSVTGLSIDVSDLDARDIYALGLDIYEQLIAEEGVIVEGVQYDVVTE